MTHDDQIAGPKVICWVILAILLEIMLALGIANA
jgi:hypothetical protein